MKKKQKKRTEMVFGVGWYRAEQWPLLLAVSVDRDELEPTYAEWLDVAESSLASLRMAGLDPVKIDVDVEEMIAWCSEKAKPLNANARVQFITAKTKQMDQGG